MLREYDLLGPLEGVSGLVIGVDKGVDLIANLARRGETRAGQSFGGENGEPDLDLIEPEGMGRGKMEMDVLVPRQPAVIFGLVGIEIVQNHTGAPPDREFPTAQRRRHDRLWRLALLRRHPKAGDNRARARRPDGPDGPGTHLGWAWAWPANRRNMYNRASADEQGRPWSERKRLMSWDPAHGDWVCAGPVMTIPATSRRPRGGMFISSSTSPRMASARPKCPPSRAIG